MKHVITMALLLAMLAPWPLTALAAPDKGFAVALAYNAIRITEAAGGAVVSDGGAGVTLDYQFPLGKRFSLVFSGGEDAGTPDFTAFPNANVIKQDFISLKLRLWFGAMFLGVHGGATVLVVSDTTTATVLTTGSGSGGGLEIGVESQRGWYASAETHSASAISLSNGGPTVNQGGGRVNLGYRWK